MQALKYFIKRNFGNWVYRYQKAVARKMEMEQCLEKLSAKPLNNLSDASYDVFTYHGEDGILFYLLHQLKNVPATFVDIGSGDCIKGNCANLAIHFGWSGVFIDMNKKQLAIGKSFYKNSSKKGIVIHFVEAEVTAGNINQLLQVYTAGKRTGLLSIDIDGNDYWIWKAIEVIQPEIVLIEAKVEFGYKSMAVPYGKQNHHSADSKYNGASIEAMRKLGKEKGYKLAGANKQGYNLFFVKQDCHIPEATTASVLSDPETVSSFYHEAFFAAHKFEII
jgi:hypothetical protein